MAVSVYKTDYGSANSKLRGAIARGDFSDAKSWLRRGADLDHRADGGWQPLHHAAFFGHAQMVVHMLQQRADVRAPSDSGEPMHAAAMGKRPDMIELLLRRRAGLDSSDSEGMHPLDMAAIGGDSKTLAMLLQHRASPDARSHDGSQAVHQAAQAGHTQVLTSLLEHAASINEPRSDGMQPIHIAAVAGHSAVASLFLELSVHVGASGSDGLQPIHIAARCGHTELMRFLVDRFADVNAKAGNGMRPLEALSSQQPPLDEQRQKEVSSFVASVSQVVSLHAEANQERCQGRHRLALGLFDKALVVCQPMGLRRLMGKIAADASRCQLGLRRFDECSRLCQVALAVKNPPLDCFPELKSRLRKALEGIKLLREGKQDLAELIPGDEDLQAAPSSENDCEKDAEGNLDAIGPASDCTSVPANLETAETECEQLEEHDKDQQQAPMVFCMPIGSTVSEDDELAATYSDNITRPDITEQLHLKIAEIAAKRDRALAEAADLKTELAASKDLCQELQRRWPD
eukprot:TRINITY_DN8236_c0_g1_i2.p1 TRINITY_DN8236_c0_g1~~TRINITY_DN8236_c0_g1_i2.p1  ORF type:complete len:517 (+),score=108.17 TRINITY_DN8236_c0_g1_i2:84-1634(+)